MIDLTGTLVIINLAIVVGGIIATRIVLRSSLAKSENEIKERIVADLGKENELLRSRVQRLEAENRRMSKLMQLIITTLKKLHGIDMDIEDDVITLRSANGNVSRVSTDA